MTRRYRLSLRIYQQMQACRKIIYVVTKDVFKAYDKVWHEEDGTCHTINNTHHTSCLNSYLSPAKSAIFYVVPQILFHYFFPTLPLV